MTNDELKALWRQWANEGSANETQGRMQALEILTECLNTGSNYLSLRHLGLTSLPAELPPRVEILLLSYNRLIALPAHLPPALNKLDVSNNILPNLPENLPSSLTSLDISHNQVSILPSTLPTSLSLLQISNNLLSRLPDNLPPTLISLDISNNWFTNLPNNLPPSLETLDIRHNSVRTLPDILPHSLTILNATDNALTALPNNLPPSLTLLEVDENRLTTLPDTLPPSLETIDISINDITSLPESLFHLPPTTEVIVEDNPLPLDVLQALQARTHAPGYRGPYFQFSIFDAGGHGGGHGVEAPVYDLHDEVAAWFTSEQQGAVRAAWTPLGTEENAGEFARFLHRLNVEVRAHQSSTFRERVAAWLTRLAGNPELRATTFLISHGATETCQDRVSLEYNAMQKAEMETEVRHGDYDSNLPELITRAREVFRMEELAKIARIKAQGMRAVDEIEVYLAYQVGLRDELHLSSVTDHMYYERFSNVDPADLQAAGAQVRGAEDSRFTEWLSQWGPWQDVLRRIAPEAAQAAQSAREAALDTTYPARLTQALREVGLENDPDAERELGRRVMNELNTEIDIRATQQVLTQKGKLSLLDSPWPENAGQQYNRDGAGPSSLHQLVTHEILQRVGAWRLSDIISPYTALGAELHFAPQGIMLGDGAQGICDALSEAWLFALGQDETGALETALLDAVFLHSERLAGEDAVPSSYAHSVLNMLGNIHSTGARVSQSLNEIVHSLISASGDLYLSLHAGNHALSLARRTLNGETRYFFYDPNLGEVSLPAGNSVGESDLKSLISDILGMKTGNGQETLAGFYDTERSGGEYSFTVQITDPAKQASLPEFMHLKDQLTADRSSAATFRRQLDALSGTDAARSAAVQVMDTLQGTQQALADDIRQLNTRIHDRITAAGHAMADIVPDILYRFDNVAKKLIVTVHNAQGSRTEVSVDIADLTLHSETLLNDAIERLKAPETPVTPGMKEGVSEALGKGIGALMTLRSLQSMLSSLDRGDTGDALAGAGWSAFGLASLTGVDRAVIDNIGQALGSVIFRDATVPVRDMSSFLSGATRSLLMSAGVESERVLSVAGSALARLPVMALAFGGWAVSEDIKTLQADQKAGMPGWKIALDGADIGLDSVSTAMQTVAPFTGPVAPFIEAAAMLLMGIRMTIDDIVSDFHSGHDSRATANTFLSVLVPTSVIIKSLVKLATDDPTILGVNDVDNLFNISADTQSPHQHWLDLTRGSLLSDNELSDGNPARYAGNLTIDFSQVGEKGGRITLSGQHAPHSGVTGLSDKSYYTNFSGSRQVSSGIDNIILGRGAAYNRDGELLSGNGMQYIAIENGEQIPSPEYSAVEHIIASAGDNTFVAPDGDATVKDKDDHAHLYRYDIHAGDGDDVLNVAGGQYEFDGERGRDTIAGARVTPDQTDQALVWDLSAQHPLPIHWRPRDAHRFVTALSAAQMKEAAEGRLATVNSRTLLSSTQIEADGVENLIGGYRTRVSVTGTNGAALSSFMTSGSSREVFVGDSNKNIISTGGGDDVIYRSAGNDTFVIDRSFTLTAAHGADHPDYATDESARAALLAAGTEKHRTYTVVTLVTPGDVTPGEDLVSLEGARFNDIRLQEDAVSGKILVGYGDTASGLFVQVAGRAALTGLHFTTDDGVTFRVSVPKDIRQPLSLDIEVVQGKLLVNKNNGDTTLQQAAGEDGFDIMVSRGEVLTLPSGWGKGTLMLDASFSELRYRHDGLGDFVIDTGDDPRLNSHTGDARHDLQVNIPQTAHKEIALRTRDGYFIRLRQTSPGVWTNEHVQASLTTTSGENTLTAGLLKALLTQGTGAISEGELTQDKWKSRQVTPVTGVPGTTPSSGVLVTGDRHDGWLLGGAGNDTLMANGGTTLLDGGAGVDTYVLACGQGTVVIADSGVHVAAANWGKGVPDGRPGMVAFSDVTFSDIHAVMSVVDVNNGSKQPVLVLTGQGTPGVTAKILASDIAGYQFVSADGVSFVYRMDANGYLVQHVTGLDQTSWNKWYAPENKRPLPDMALLLNGPELRYDGSNGADNVTLRQPGVLVTPGQGSDTLHLRPDAGAVVLRAGDGDKTLYLDVSAGHSRQLPVPEEARLTGVKKEIWNHVAAGDGAHMSSVATSRPADLTENNALLYGLLSPGQLLRLTGSVLLHSNHTYQFRNPSSGQLSLDVTGPSSGGYHMQTGADGTVTIAVLDSGQGDYHFSLLTWNAGEGSYDLHYGSSDYVTTKTGNLLRPPVEGMTARPAGDAQVLLHFQDFSQQDVHGQRVNKSIAIQNSGFEGSTAAVQGWEFRGGTGEMDSLDNSSHSEGKQSVSLSGGTLGQTLTQTLANDTDYSLSVDVNKTTGAGVILRLLAGNTVLGELDGATLPAWSPTGWQQLTLNVKGMAIQPHAGEALRIEIVDADTGSDNTLAVDNVQLTASHTMTLSAGQGASLVSANLQVPDAVKYQVATGDGLISLLNQDGTLTLSHVDFGLRTEKGALDMRARHESTAPGQWLTVAGDGQNNVFIAGTAQAVMLNGGAGDDVVQGSHRADIFSGGGGNDILLGEGGDDALTGGSGADVLDGGAGVDTVFYLGDSAKKQGVSVDLSTGRGTGADAEGDLLRNIENVKGSEYADVLRGSSTDNVLDGGAGDDILSGGGGHDVLRGGAGADTCVIRAGDNVLLDKTLSSSGHGAGDDTATDTVVLAVTGAFLWTKVDNTLVVTCKNTTLMLKDWYARQTAQNYQFILPGKDAASGRRLTGAEFEAWLKAGAVPEQSGTVLSSEEYTKYQALLAPVPVTGNITEMTGSTGDDILTGNATHHRLWGNAGNDILEGSAGSDVLDGGGGNDTASYEHSTGAVQVDLSLAGSYGQVVATGGGDAQGDVLRSIENLRGSAGDDILTGDEGDNVIEGGGGRDILKGGGGFDILSYAHSVAYWVPEEHDDHVHARSEQKGKNIGVYVDLASGEASRGDAGVSSRDSISGFEGVEGSAWADDLSGDGGNNLFILNGFQNDGHNDQRDHVDGRGGSDTVSFSRHFYDRGVSVALNTGLVTWEGGNPVAFLTGIENVTGSAGKDVLEGNSQNNTLSGGKGDDWLAGGGGVDWLTGGEGADTYKIKTGDHVIISQADNGIATDSLLFADIRDPLQELQFIRQGDDLLIRDSDGKTSALLTRWAQGDTYYVLKTAGADIWLKEAQIKNQRLTVIRNSSFEDSTAVVEGWEYRGSAGEIESLDNSSHSEGRQSVSLSGGTLGQTLTLTLANRTDYSLSVDVNKTTGTGVILRLLAGSTVLGQVDASVLSGWTAGHWQQLTLNVKGVDIQPHFGERLRIEIADNDAGNDNTLGVDNVQLKSLLQQEVKPPVTHQFRSMTVDNGGFEDNSTPSDIFATPVFGWSGRMKVNHDTGSEGRQCAELDGGAMFQTLRATLENDTDYQLKVDVAQKNSGKSVLLQLMAGNTVLGELDSGGASGYDWHTLTLDVKGQAVQAHHGEALAIKLSSHGGGEPVLVDNVRLSRLSAAMATMGNGAGTLPVSTDTFIPGGSLHPVLGAGVV